MTHKEALEKVTECGLNIEEPLHSEVMKLVKATLEKQIPKKPTIKKSCKVNAFWLRCPNCEAVLQSDSPHCKYCGQALDWSDTE